jgi:hypothetical protein
MYIKKIMGSHYLTKPLRNLRIQTLAGTFVRLTTALAAACVYLPASAQNNVDAPEGIVVPDVVAPVLYAYATLARQQTDSQICWQVLTSQRDVLVREHNAKPWLLRNLAPIVGAAMGGVVGGLVLKKHFSTQIAKRWALPVIAGSGAAGFMVGPGGVAGFVVGGAIGDKLGKLKLPAVTDKAATEKRRKLQLPITIGSAAGGALIGKMLWDMVFPPDVPPAPGNEPEDDIPVEVFVREQVCGGGVQTAYEQSVYRVGYRFKGEELVADLPYDPGEALLLSATGNITGPARVRLD